MKALDLGPGIRHAVSQVMQCSTVLGLAFFPLAAFAADCPPAFYKMLHRDNDGYRYDVGKGTDYEDARREATRNLLESAGLETAPRNITATVKRELQQDEKSGECGGLVYVGVRATYASIDKALRDWRDGKKAVTPSDLPAAAQATGQCGLWVTNKRNKDLRIIAHHRGPSGWKDIDAGIVGAGQRVYFPATKGNFISLTFRSGWFFRRSIQQAFEEGPGDVIHEVTIR